MKQEDALAIADLTGFLRAFALVNSKCDNGFTFRVECVDDHSDIESAVARQFAAENASHIAIKQVAYSREFLTEILVRWLLCYLNDPIERDRLQDARQNFCLSHPECHPQLINPILNVIEALVPARTMYTIELTTKHFYACDSNDLVIASDDRMLFLHFSVSD